MKEIKFIDRGIEEVIIVDGRIEIKVDWMSPKQLMGLLSRYELLNVDMISYDEAFENGL